MTPDRPGQFAATRWTLVVRAQGSDTQARTALAELCEAYYTPVVAFLRAEGRTEDAARDLAHEFFAQVLSRSSITGADEKRGRFRNYLLGALKHFLSDRREREQAAKRGAGAEHVAIDDHGAPEHATEFNTSNFDRQWALAIISRAMEIVEKELREAGKGSHFDALKPWLIGARADAIPLSQADAARALGMNENAVKVAIHRLRQRFREAVKAEIAQTVPADSDVDDELRHLIAVLVAS